jgi:two-component system response regulator YesN
MLKWIKHVVGRIQEDSQDNGETLSVIEKVKRYISLHIGDNPGREDLANYVYLNPDYLTRLFKKQTGMTLIGYLQNVRIQYAKDLLMKTDLSVSKIAAQFGYSNFSHFTRAFKEITGVSPTEFKNSYKGKQTSDSSIK